MGNVLRFPMPESEPEGTDETINPYDVFNQASPPELPEGWKRKGLCASRDIDPDLFFPIHDEKSSSQVKAQQARIVCAQCPVRNECLTHALLYREKQGVWGGTTDKERKAILNKRPSWRKCNQCGSVTFGLFYVCCRVTHD